MLSKICGYLKNWFEQEKYIGDFRIANGRISVTSRNAAEPQLLDGQYIRIIGSVHNDGVYQYHVGESITGLVDEKFHGAVWALAIPKELLELAEEITAWQEKYGNASLSPYASESLSASSYSYSRGSVGSDGSATITWKNIFADQLRRWRKI